MTKWLLVVGLIIMLGWAVANHWLSREQALEADIGLDMGDLAPDFALETMHGEMIRLSDYRGTPILLNFWATWCPPCREEMPDMERLHQETGMKVIAVNLTATENSLQAIDDFATSYQLTFPMPLDKKNLVAEQYQILPIPTTYIIDSQGIIQLYVFGPLQYEDMLREYQKLR